jgi:hypothetical protein
MTQTLTQHIDQLLALPLGDQERLHHHGYRYVTMTEMDVGVLLMLMLLISA